MLEVTARSGCESERQFMQKVLRLQWISAFWNESAQVVRRQGLPDPESPWCSLGMMQRRRLGGEGSSHNDVQHNFEWTARDNNEVALMPALKAVNAIAGDPVSREEKMGAIVIPASSCSSPDKRSPKVSFLPSFSGGQQLFVKEDAEIEFTLSSPVFDRTVRQYKLTCRVCTVHRSEEALLLTVMSGDRSDPDTVHVVDMPYTMGMWRETEPIVVEVGAASKIHLARPQQDFGFSFKEIRLIPV